MSIAVLAIAAYDYSWLQYLGFPDGHLTELDRARQPLHSVFIGLSVLGGLCFGYLATIASAKQRRVGIPAVIFLYSAVGLTTVLIDWYLSSYLDGGIGG